MQDKVLCDKYMGKFPVISISLKLWDAISIRDTAARMNQKEHFYHGMAFAKPGHLERQIEHGEWDRL